MVTGGTASPGGLAVALGASFVEQGAFSHLNGVGPGRRRWRSIATGGFRADEIRATHLPTALALEPDVALVDAGGNDALQERALALITADLEAIYTALEGIGARVLVARIQPFGNYAPTTAEAFARRAELEAYIDGLPYPAFSYAEAIGDGTDPVGTAAAYDAGDGLHLNAAGDLRCSTIAARTFAAALL